MPAGRPNLQLRDEPATKVRQRRDFDAGAVAGTKGCGGAFPDFLSGLVALIDIMRFPIGEIAYVVLASPVK
jgi:hypothetical protein